MELCKTILFEGRQLNQRYTLESLWFILREAMEKDNNKDLIELGIKIFDWMWEWGWDKEYGEWFGYSHRD